VSGLIYLLNDDLKLLPMQETTYDSESMLQKLLATHPALLAGEQVNVDRPRRWLLVTREMSVQAEHDGPARWSLDHLFLDQDAVPTLVEVKRSCDTRIRREVVGQMLDYAANATTHWSVEQIKSRFENTCASEEERSAVLAELLGEEYEVEKFWQEVKDNLEAGRIRMIFLADTIPTELRTVVEFLNEQMNPAEVLAVEVKQYVYREAGREVKTLVPRVFGQTEAARGRKGGGVSSKTWNEDLFMAVVRERHGEAAQAAAKDLLDWLTPRVTRFWWGDGAVHGGIVPIIQRGRVKYHVGRMGTEGRFAFRFDWLIRKPPFSDEAVRLELLRRINEIPGVQFDDAALTTRARVPYETVVNPAAMAKLKAAIGWLIEKIKAERECA